MPRQPNARRRPLAPAGRAPLLGAVLLIAATGYAACADVALSGRYSNRNGMMRLDFQPNGKVLIDDNPLSYQVSGSTVTITTPKGDRTLTIIDEDTLALPDGGDIRLVRDRSFDCTDADGEIGTLVLSHTGEVLLKAPDGTPQAADGPQSIGTFTEDAGAVTIVQPDGSLAYARDGRDLKADGVTCRRL